MKDELNSKENALYISFLLERKIAANEDTPTTVGTLI